jgi:hypothetical protein
LVGGGEGVVGKGSMSVSGSGPFFSEEGNDRVLPEGREGMSKTVLLILTRASAG